MKTEEFRGCRRLVIAEVLEDTESAYRTGPVMPLAPVAEIAKTVETSSEVHYYDNKPSVVVSSEGEDTVTFTSAVPDDATLAKIEGRTYDPVMKRFIESEREEKHYAVGYVLGEEGDESDERLVWRYKGKFAQIPDETSATKDNGTGANNMSLVYTGIYPTHKFANGKGTGKPGYSKASYIRTSDNVMTEDQWFAAVNTPDSSIPDTYILAITQDEDTTVTVTRNGSELINGAVISVGDVLTITVTGGTVTVNGSAFTSGNTHTVAGNVAVVSTAS